MNQEVPEARVAGAVNTGDQFASSPELAESADAPDEEQGEPLAQLRTRERRFQWMALLYVASLGMAAYASTRPWWTFRLSPTTIEPSSGVQVTNVHATAQLTPAWLASHQVIGAYFGIPEPVALLALAALIGGVAVFARSSAVGVVSLVCDAIAWHAMTAAQLTVAGHSGLVHTAGGLSMFETALAVTAGMTVVLSAQIGWINHRIRVEERAHAEANGLAVMPRLVDMVHGFQLGHLARFGRGAEVMTSPRAGNNE